MKLRKQAEVETGGGRVTTMIAAVRAGEETAARLGVPVGTIIEGRKVHLNMDTGEQYTKPEDSILTAEETIALVGDN